MNVRTTFARYRSFIIGACLGLGLILILNNSLAQVNDRRARLGTGQGAQVGGPQDPMPAFDFGDQTKSVVVRLSFNNTDQVALLSAKVVVGRPHVRLGDPPLLRIRLLDHDGQLIEQYNAWDPRLDYSVEANDEQAPPPTLITGRFIVPFSPQLKTMQVFDLPQQKLLTAIDLDSAAIYPFCQQHPSDPDCAAVPPSLRITTGMQALYTFSEGFGTTVNDVSGVGMPLNLEVSNAAVAQWRPGGLALTAPVLIASTGPATKVIEAARATNALTLEAWIAPANLTEHDPTRILGISGGRTTRNVTLAQGVPDARRPTAYSVRLRTSQTNESGRLPLLTTPDGQVMPSLTHVVYTRDPQGTAILYVNGSEQARNTVRGDFSTWDASYRLTLANELSGDRAWLGEYQLVALYNRALSPVEIAQHMIVGPTAPWLPVP